MFQIQQILLLSCVFALSQCQFIQQNYNNNVNVKTMQNNNNVNNKKLNVLILYESLCPDSIKFISRQLGTVYDELKDYVDIQLVPFGKSYSENDGAQFYCQHGPDECEGNRKQSCVLSQTSGQDAQVKFVVCVMSQSQEYFQACAESAGLSGDIEQCMSTAQGTQLQLQAEKITEQYRPSFVPTIVYDNVFNQELQDSSIHNFRGTICRLLQKSGILGFNTSTTQTACQ